MAWQCLGASLLLVVFLMSIVAAADNFAWEQQMIEGKKAYERQDYTSAVQHFKSALGIAKKFAKNDLRLAESLSWLGVLYYHQERYIEAESLYKQELAIQEQVLGSQYPDITFSLTRIAKLYYTQGRYDEAEHFFKQSLSIRELKLNSQYPDVASSLNNLALLYTARSRYSKAEPLYMWALAIQEQVLGSQHLDVAFSLNNLAELYAVQGRYSKAKLFLRAGFSDSETVSGSSAFRSSHQSQQSRSVLSFPRAIR